jgi:arabinogalactan endo-1,4-beta-galactosidase
MRRKMSLQMFLTLSGVLMLSGAGLAAERAYYFGADLSYVNEIQDCGASFKRTERLENPYKIFKEAGTNLVRIRLWNEAKWTHYSNLADVEKAMTATRAQGLPVLLDFHYSDDWADGEKQLAPKAWEGLSDADQAKALYAFTFDTLSILKARGLMPDMVQVGNETNHEIVSSLEGAKKPINWSRNALLFNAGIRAVHDASKDSAIKPKIMLHIAQPENVETWFDAATRAGVTDYDIIGISYYRKWSKLDMGGLSGVIRRSHERFGKEVVIVETSYPFTLSGNDQAPNLLGEDSLIPGYPATPEGQARYMRDIMQLTLDNGGAGVVYWEPAWVSTRCKTRWGQGSHWENATFFDFKGEALPALDWARAGYVMPVEITFRVKADPSLQTLYLGADFLAGEVVPLRREGEDFIYRTWVRPEHEITFAISQTREGVADAEARKAVPSAQNSVIGLSHGQ